MRRWFQFVCAIAIAVLLPLEATSLQIAPDGGVIMGRIVAADGTPVVGIRVGALAVSSASSPSAVSALMSLSPTDRDGYYRLENVPAGKYYIVADRLDSPIYYPGVVDPSSATILTIAAGENVKGQDFRLSGPLWLKVSGRVIREGNRAGTEVILTNSGGTVRATIKADGSFEFPQVRPGTYQARVQPRLNALTPLTVIVSDKNVSNLEFPIPLSAITEAVVSFNVTLEGGGLLPRFQLQFVPLGSTQPSNLPTRVRVLGIPVPVTQEVLPIPLGEYQLGPPLSGTAALPPGYVLKSVTAGPIDLLTQPLKITAMDAPVIAITLGVTSPPPWVTLKGHITGVDATQTAPTSLTIAGSPLAAQMMVPVKADGSFEIPMILPGTYQARLTPAADPFPRTIVVGAAIPATVEIPIKLPLLRVEGTARSQPLRPSQFLRAMLRPEPPDLGRGAPNSTSVAANGSFAFPAVQPGLYVLSIAVCESDVCQSTGGIPLVVDKDIAGLDVSTQDNVLPAGTRLAAAVATVPAAESIEGTVVVEGGAAVPSFRLRFIQGAVTRSLSVSEKSFTASLLPGTYQVTIADLPVGYELRSITEGNGDLRARPLTVAPSPGGLLPLLSVPRIIITLGVKQQQ